ncbi:MAG: hypothetical protein QMC77_06505 [Methanocellales archaeon]|nr:hypothetical protein [Methanocellales archaeon]MDI6903368.1 hypothetical protein [Methanocellales archaeon]
MVEEKPDARVSMEEWPEIVFRFASEYKRSKDENVVKLLGGLWLARYADFVEETRDMDLNDAEKVVHNQMLSFLEKRDLLVEIY